MINTIVGRIFMGYALFCLLLIAGLGTTFLLTSGQRDDGFIVNLAGRQRMLTQKLTKEVLVFTGKSGQGDVKESSKWAVQIQSTMKVFESTLNALKDGGPAPTNLDMTNFRSCPQAGTDEIKGQLEKVNGLWVSFKNNIVQVLETDGQNKGAVDYVIGNSGTLLKEMDTAVTLMQTEAEKKVSQFLWIQVAVVMFGIFLVMAGSFIVKITIADPILRLIKAADEISKGNLKDEVQETGTREIVNLAVSFNRMRISLQKMLERLGKMT